MRITNMYDTVNVRVASTVQSEFSSSLWTSTSNFSEDSIAATVLAASSVEKYSNQFTSWGRDRSGLCRSNSTYTSRSDVERNRRLIPSTHSSHPSLVVSSIQQFISFGSCPVTRSMTESANARSTLVGRSSSLEIHAEKVLVTALEPVQLQWRVSRLRQDPREHQEIPAHLRPRGLA